MSDRETVAIKCYKCGAWYHTKAIVETKYETMTRNGITAQLPRKIIRQADSHSCKGKGLGV